MVDKIQNLAVKLTASGENPLKLRLQMNPLKVGATIGFIVGAFIAQGGVAPYAYSITTGSLPSGLSLNSSTGAISVSGALTAGKTEFVASVTDSETPSPVIFSATFEIDIGEQIYWVQSSTQPVAEDLIYYQYQFAIGGSTGTLTWSYTGSLPPGITLDSSTGLLSGAPTVSSGSYTFVVSVTDSGTGETISANQNIICYPTLVTFGNTPSTAQTLIIGQTYNRFVVANYSGGAPPVAVSLQADSIPSGMTQNIDGTISGVVTGTPQTYLTGFTVSDAAGSSVINGTYIIVATANAQIQPQQQSVNVGVAGPVNDNYVGATVGNVGGTKTVETTFFAGTTANTGNTYTATPSPAITQYATNQIYVFHINAANTGAATINVNGLGALPVKFRGAALTGGEMPLDAMMEFLCDGSNFHILAGETGTVTGVLFAANNLSDVASEVASLDNLTPLSSNIASAATTDLSTATGRNVTITGTTTITALGTCAAGVERVTRFAGALTLTHNATTMICITAANITTAAGDECGWVSLGSGDWRMQWYAKADGTALVSSGGGSSGYCFNRAGPLTVPLASAFTTFNGTSTGTITLTDKSNRLQIAALGDGGAGLLGCYQSSIATPYTVDMGFAIAGNSAAATCASGLFLSDGTALRVIMGGASSTSLVNIGSWSNISSFAGYIFQKNTTVNPGNYWIRITDDGTTRKFWISANGLDYVQVYSEATNTYVTPTRFGMFVLDNSGSGWTDKISVYHYLVTNSVLGDGA
jgi:hypothetical protein